MEDEKSAEESANMESDVIRKVVIRNMARERCIKLSTGLGIGAGFVLPGR